MKKIKLLLYAIPLFYLISCRDEVSISNQPSITQSIEKIETSYKQGDPAKIENYSIGEKIETSMDEIDLEKLKSDINNQIQQKLSKMQDKYKIARTIYDGYDVGVIPNVDACPSWSEKIKFFMDCQDGNSGTGWKDTQWYTNNYKGAWYVDGNKNVGLIFCRVDGRSFYNVTNSPFALLRLGASQPSGMQGIITRYFDNEDSNNTNYSEGDLGPNTSNANTTLQFYVTDGYYANPVPDFGFGYGVVGGTLGYETGTLYTDDEDRRNGNSMTLSNPSMYYGMIVPGGNTTIYISKQKL